MGGTAPDLHKPRVHILEPTETGTRVIESFDAEKVLGPVMTWLTEKWVGSDDRDADLRRGMTETLARLQATAERA